MRKVRAPGTTLATTHQASVAIVRLFKMFVFSRLFYARRMVLHVVIPSIIPNQLYLNFSLPNSMVFGDH